MKDKKAREAIKELAKRVDYLKITKVDEKPVPVSSRKLMYDPWHLRFSDEEMNDMVNPT